MSAQTKVDPVIRTDVARNIREMSKAIARANATFRKVEKALQQITQNLKPQSKPYEQYNHLWTIWKGHQQVRHRHHGLGLPQLNVLSPVVPCRSLRRCSWNRRTPPLKPVLRPQVRLCQFYCCFCTSDSTLCLRTDLSHVIIPSLKGDTASASDGRDRLLKWQTVWHHLPLGILV